MARRFQSGENYSFSRHFHETMQDTAENLRAIPPSTVAWAWSDLLISGLREEGFFTPEDRTALVHDLGTFFGNVKQDPKVLKAFIHSACDLYANMEAHEEHHTRIAPTDPEASTEFILHRRLIEQGYIKPDPTNTPENILYQLAEPMMEGLYKDKTLSFPEMNEALTTFKAYLNHLDKNPEAGKDFVHALSLIMSEYGEKN